MPKTPRTFNVIGAHRFFYRSTSQNPYKSDEAEKIDIYVSEDGNGEAWVKQGTDRLVQYGPSSGLMADRSKTPDNKRLYVSELRAKAVETVIKARPDFEKMRTSLHPLEDHKDRELYFFRWDDFSGPVREDELQPFIQVGIRANGTLVSFTDTLKDGKEPPKKNKCVTTITVKITLVDGAGDDDAELVVNDLQSVLDDNVDVAGWESEKHDEITTDLASLDGCDVHAGNPCECRR